MLFRVKAGTTAPTATDVSAGSVHVILDKLLGDPRLPSYLCAIALELRASAQGGHSIKCGTAGDALRNHWVCVDPPTELLK